MRVGMPDHFTYTLDGDLTIKASGQDAGARMDFHAWLLKLADNGNGDFQGYFQYAGGNFDGRLWGQLNFMDGLASLSLGDSANNAAVDMHFGNGPCTSCSRTRDSSWEAGKASISKSATAR